MTTTLKQDMAEFRFHVAELRKMGYTHAHIHVKAGTREFFLETAAPAEGTEHIGSPIGFHSDDEEDEE